MPHQPEASSAVKDRQFEDRRRFELRYAQRFKCRLRKVDNELAFLPGPEVRSIDWIRDLYRAHGELPASRFALLAFDHNHGGVRRDVPRSD
ncbi:hypothetical protein [Streptomyces sp. NPDC058279]|uniref:hypothetical protein n=1 Tax=Streptomyces sp. NPDC058279 TaxID=3346418 RepID=UPI0036EA213E